MQTIIATETGPKTVTARPCVVPGLYITGARGAWTITHAASGCVVCRPSLANANITLDGIRNAVMLAEAARVALGERIDWTLSSDKLPRKACIAWVRSVFRSIRMA